MHITNHLQSTHDKPLCCVGAAVSGDDNNTAIVIGGSVAAVVLTTIFVGLMVYMRRRHRLKASPPPRAWQASDNIPGIASRPPKPPATSDAASAGASGKYRVTKSCSNYLRRAEGFGHKLEANSQHETRVVICREHMHTSELFV